MKLYFICITLACCITLLSSNASPTLAEYPTPDEGKNEQEQIDKMQEARARQLAELREQLEKERAARAQALLVLEEARQQALKDREQAEQNLRQATEKLDSVLTPPSDGTGYKEGLQSRNMMIIQSGAKIDALEGTIRILKERNIQLTDEVARLKAALRKAGINPEATAPTPKGKITATKGTLVEISIGSDDGVKLGQEYNIFRGSKFIGRIKIIHVKSNRSVGSNTKDISPDIRKIGDSVELIQPANNEKEEE